MEKNHLVTKGVRVCPRRGSGFRPPPGGKKPFGHEGGQGLGPPGVEKNHLVTKGVKGPPGGKKPFGHEGGQGLGPKGSVLIKNPEKESPPRSVDFSTKKSHFELGPRPILGSPHLGCFWRHGPGKKPFGHEGGQGLGPPGVEKNHMVTKVIRV